jgi:hypothetical protein
MSLLLYKAYFSNCIKYALTKKFKRQNTSLHDFLLTGTYSHFPPQQDSPLPVRIADLPPLKTGIAMHGGFYRDEGDKRDVHHRVLVSQN